MSVVRRRHGSPWWSVLASLLLVAGLLSPDAAGVAMAATDPMATDAPAAAVHAIAAADPARAGGRVDLGGLPASERADRVIITWADDAGPRLLRGARLRASQPGMRLATRMTARTDAWWLGGAKRGIALRRQLQQVAAIPGVRLVEPDRLLQADLVPNDTRYAGNQWHLWGTYGIKAPAAWDATTGSSTVIVAVIDTGYTTHTEMGSRILSGYDFISDSRIGNDGNGIDSDASDTGDWITSAEAASGFFLNCRVGNSSWHGTHVNGIVAAAGNNGTGVAGVGWSTSILPVRVLGKCGGYTSDIVNGIRWAAGASVAGAPANATPADIINLSLGGTGVCSTTLQSAIDTAVGLGTLVVVAAGNETDLAANHNPANCNNVVTVAATDSAGKRSSFSNYGSTVEIAAPGSSIDSTLNSGTTSPSTQSYALYSGTSMATPVVAGVAALMLAVDPTLTPAQLTELLIANAGPFGPDAAGTSCGTLGCGAGIVDAASSVAAATSAAPVVKKLALRAASDSGTSSSDRVTSATSLVYDLVFDKQVTDVTAADLPVTGTATGCTVGTLTGSGTSRVVTLTGCSEGTVILRFAADGALNASSVSGPAADAVAATVTVDLTGPAAPSITTAVASPTNATSIAWTVAFGESVAGIAAADFNNAGSATGCTFTPSATSGSSITLTVTTCSAPGTLRPRLLANGVTDAAGNTGPGTTTDSGTTLTLDRTAPSVSSLTTASGSPTAATEIAWTLTFSESVTGLVAGDLSNAGSATGCTFAPSASSGTSMTITVTGCSTTGTLQPRLAAAGVTDTAGNTGPASAFTATTTLTLDRVGPTVSAFSSAVSSPTNSTSIAYTLTFGETVSGIESADLVNAGTATGCAFAPSASDASSVTVTVTGCSVTGTLTPRLLAGSVTDALGNVGPAAAADATTTLTLDRVAPSVVAFSSVQTSPTNATSIAFTLTFDAAISGLAAADLSNAGTLSGCTFTPSASSGTTFTVTVTGCAGSGTLQARLASGSVTDGAGNTGPASAADATTTIDVDRAAPSVTAFSSTDSSPSSATTFSYTLTFDSSIVTLAGGDLENAGTATGCTFAPSSASGSTFTITVDGCSSGTLQPRLTAGSVADGVGNPGPASPATATATITIDRGGPEVLGFSSAVGSPTNSTSIDYSLSFSEEVSGLAAGDLSNAGTATGCAFSPSAATGSTFTITVTDCSATGTLRPRLAAGAVDDTLANPGPSSAALATTTLTLDRVGPSVSAFSSAVSSPTNGTSIGYTLTFPEAVSGLAAGDLSNAGTATGCAFGVSAGPASSFTITVTGCSTTGTLQPRLVADAVADALGNPGPTADADATSTLTLDRVAPSVTAFSSAVSSPAKGTSIDYTLTFDEPVSGLAAADLSNQGSATGCAFAPSAGPASSFTVTVSGCSATGTLQPRLAAGGVTDAAGNAGPASAADATTTLTLDRVAPTVTGIGLQAASDSGASSSDRRTKAATLIFDLTFSEPVAAPAAGDLATSGTAAGCAITDPAGSGTDRTVTLTGCGEGTVTLRFLAGVAADIAGNVGPAADVAAATVTIDRTAPAVTIASASGAFTESPDLVFTVSGSEALDCSTLTAADLDVTNGTIGTITDNGTGCDVAVTSGVADGAQGSTSLAAAGGFAVADAAGNAAGSATGTPSVTVDRRGPDTVTPTVSDVAADPASAAPGATITVTATASDDRVITAAQARIAGGAWKAASAADGAFDEAGEAVTASLDLPAGDAVQVCVRATDAASHTSDPVCTTVQVSGAAGVAAGGAFTCVALADGSARCFGANDQGQLGDGLTAASALPVVVRTAAATPLGGVVAVASGNLHACAVLGTGRVACWGDNAYGKLGDGTTTDRLFATLVPGLTGVTAVTAGTDHTCARRSDGTVRCWGRNGSGRLGDGTTTTRTSPVAVTGLANVTAIAAGGAHTCARLSSGAMRCWGLNTDGQLGDGTKTARKTPVAVKGISGVTAIAAGAAHTCARLNTGALRCFGDNSAGQLGDGTLVDRTTAVAVKTITTATGIAAGGKQSCAVLADGSARCWGLNASAQLGDGTTTTRKAPVVVAGLSGRTVLSLATGTAHSCARLASGGVSCWGANAVGQLGDGTTTDRPTPNRVRRLSGDARDRVTVTIEPDPTPKPKPAPSATPGPDGPASTPAPPSEPEVTPAPEPDATPAPVPSIAPDPSPEPPPAG